MISKIKTFSCGFCKQFEKMACKSGGWRIKKFPAKCFLISLPDGYMLFDAGYPADFNDTMNRWPYILYKRLVPACIDPQETCLNQLKKENINAEDIKYIFISHFHADHIGALRDFPQAGFICSKREYHKLKTLNVRGQLLKGFVNKFLPEDFEGRVVYIEELQKTKDTIFSLRSELPFIKDIFAVPLPGHTTGQFGLWLPEENTLLAADSAWTKENYSDEILPHWIALRFCEDKKAFCETLKLLGNLKDIKILLSHGEE